MMDIERARDGPAEEEQSRESGMPGGGKGRKDAPGYTGVYPVSHMAGADPQATTHGEMTWGQGERGAAGYVDRGESEVFTVPGDEAAADRGSSGPITRLERR
jgi:hypothetical protein